MLEGPHSKVEPSGGAEASGTDRNSGRKVISNCQSDNMIDYSVQSTHDISITRDLFLVQISKKKN